MSTDPFYDGPDILLNQVLQSSHNVANSLKSLLNDKIKKPNLFIMPYDPHNEVTITKFQKIYSRLKMDFDISLFELLPQECHISNLKNSLISPSLILKCIAIDSGKPEAIRDIIKETLWPLKITQKIIKVIDILTRNGASTANHFKLSEHGLFTPYIKKSYGKIRTHSFNHKPIYRYRLSINNAKNLPHNLASYLNLLFTDCPNHIFRRNEFRVSGKTCKNCEIDIELTHETNHELINLAKQSRSFNKFKSRHENLQKFFLEKDSFTVACEIPVWIGPNEFEDYSKFFNQMEALTGHIDILRLEENGKIGVWDYKPGAFHEQNAQAQVFLYSFMLAARTGITLENFICGYFDEVDIFYFNPSEIKVFNITKPLNENW